MGQSLIKTYIHIIFSTKDRVPFILPAYEQELHEYIAEICNDLLCCPLKIGGSTDHVHILCMISPRVSLEKLLKEVKTESSKWMRAKDESLKDFHWQIGYGAFSINEIEVNEVVEYIANQRVYHINKTFQEEYRSILNENEMEFDEADVWD